MSERKIRRAKQALEDEKRERDRAQRMADQEGISEESRAEFLKTVEFHKGRIPELIADIEALRA